MENNFNKLLLKYTRINSEIETISLIKIENDLFLGIIHLPNVSKFNFPDSITSLSPFLFWLRTVIICGFIFRRVLLAFIL